MANSRFYNRKEISTILAKASEIQLKHPREDENGLTEAELIHIATEAGINKNALQQALVSFENDDAEKKFNWLKGTSKIQKISTINGDFTEDDWMNIVQEIRRITGGIGKINRVGASYEWEQRRRDIGYKHISITPKNGKTKIQYVYSWSGLKIISTMIPIVTLFTVTAIALDGSNFTNIPTLLYAFFGGLLGVPINRLFLHSYFKKQKTRVKKLFDSLSNKISKSNEPEIEIEEMKDFESNDFKTNSTPTKKTRT